MITADMLTHLGAAVDPNLGGDIVALDGKLFTILGVAALHCRWLDGPVSMRLVSVLALVFPDLDIFCCDLLVGSDLIACGEACTLRIVMMALSQMSCLVLLLWLILSLV